MIVYFSVRPGVNLTIFFFLLCSSFISAWFRFSKKWSSFLLNIPWTLWNKENIIYLESTGSNYNIMNELIQSHMNTDKNIKNFVNFKQTRRRKKYNLGRQMPRVKWISRGHKSICLQRFSKNVKSQTKKIK